MEKYLLPEDDGLPARNSGQWVAEKLFYLKRYIDIFETSMRSKPWRRRHYIDLYAGPGKCFINETGEFHLGLPLLALTTEHPFTDYVFVDLDASNINALEDVPVDFIQKIFDVMRRAWWHQFQVLTKRSKRLYELSPQIEWPKNVWMGVSVENSYYDSPEKTRFFRT